MGVQNTVNWSYIIGGLLGCGAGALVATLIATPIIKRLLSKKGKNVKALGVWIWVVFFLLWIIINKLVNPNFIF